MKVRLQVEGQSDREALDVLIERCWPERPASLDLEIRSIGTPGSGGDAKLVDPTILGAAVEAAHREGCKRVCVLKDQDMRSDDEMRVYLEEKLKPVRDLKIGPDLLGRGIRYEVESLVLTDWEATAKFFGKPASAWKDQEPPHLTKRPSLIMEWLAEGLVDQPFSSWQAGRSGKTMKYVPSRHLKDIAGKANPSLVQAHPSWPGILDCLR